MFAGATCVCNNSQWGLPSVRFRTGISWGSTSAVGRLLGLRCAAGVGADADGHKQQLSGREFAIVKRHIPALCASHFVIDDVSRS